MRLIITVGAWSNLSYSPSCFIDFDFTPTAMINSMIHDSFLLNFWNIYCTTGIKILKYLQKLSWVHFNVWLHKPCLHHNKMSFASLMNLLNFTLKIQCYHRQCKHCPLDHKTSHTINSFVNFYFSFWIWYVFCLIKWVC